GSCANLTWGAAIRLRWRSKARTGSCEPGSGPSACARSARSFPSRGSRRSRPMPPYRARMGLQHQSAVDLDDLAGDVARAVRCEEADQVGDVLDRAKSSQSDL